MTRTRTQKAVRKAQRSGKLAPDFGRKTNDAYSAISQHTRITPNKHEKLQKLKHKKRSLRDDASFFIVYFYRVAVLIKLPHTFCT